MATEKYFNNERKSQFISWKESTTVLSNNIKSVFETARDREELYGRDMCEWTSEEAIDFYKYLSTPSIQSLIQINTAVSEYTNWCLNNGLVSDNQNHYLEISSSALLQCIDSNKLRTMILTREELLNTISELPNVVDKFVFLALFEGITLKNDRLPNMRLSDIEGNVVTLCDGEKFEISSELIDLANKANSTTYYNSMGKQQRTINYVEGDTIIRPLDAKKGIQRNKTILIGSIIRRCTSYLDAPQLTIKMITESGRIDFMHRFAEKNSIPIEETINNPKFRTLHEKRFGVIQNNIVWLSTYGEFL